MSHNAPQPAGDRVMNTGRMPQPADPHTRAPQPADAQSTQQRNLSCVDSDGERLLFRILPVTLHGANKRIDTYALLDEGSSVTMIDDELLRDLDIKGERRQLNIQWFGGRATREPTTVVSMEVSGADKRKRHVLRNMYAVSSLSLPMQSLHQRDVQMWGNGARLPMKPYRGAVPKLLIGLDHAHLGLPMQTKRFAPQGPYAAATELGWVVFGPARDQPTATSSKSCLLAVSQEDAIQKMVNDYFDIENFGVKLTPQSQPATMHEHREYSKTPRYDMAYKRLVNIERKMKRNDQFKQAYMKIMDDYVHKGYARRLKQHEVALANSDKLWYLPHFGVENPNKPGKIRLVFDAAAKDRCAQRFLWRNGDDRREPDVYEMRVMTFGAACSPSAAHYVKTLNALQFQDSDPRAVKAGFELCQFTSSSPTVADALGQHGAARNIGWGEAEEKILGMCWQPATDDFKFNMKYHKVPRCVLNLERIPTKREFLSLIMSTFDPLGFLSCLMITGKLLMREIWRRNVQWDEPLPDEIARAFSKWFQDMNNVEGFRSSRHYFGPTPVRAIQLHVFVNASQSAFAAVTYLRVTYDNNDVRVCFVCARTKCAPMKTMSIPRLELQADVIGTRLIDTVKKEHSIAISDAIPWTDSKTVLRWIGSTHRRYKQFVANRVGEILETTKVSQWRWVPTAENAADDATRPHCHVDLSQRSRWLDGPTFLRQPESSWPQCEPGTEHSSYEDEEEMPSEFALVAANSFFISFQRFSSYSRLVRTTAWVLRFTRWSRGQRTELERFGLTATECENAENLLIRRAQFEAFPDEVRASYNEESVGHRSDIRGLAPYLDDNGVLRAYDRIDAALCIPHSARRPIILSHRHALTELIVYHYHVKMKHQNVDATIGDIRTRFWITKLRRLLRTVISGCSVCKLHRAQPAPPIMGPLPEDRLEANGWPFKFTGLFWTTPCDDRTSKGKEMGRLVYVSDDKGHTFGAGT
ncbi:uncharacterized protein [Drosophila virilis]|uniref:uncharacterized protein n=1 Tax=Drosophila virilis TaxID=7244 RepID=UPI0038B354CC